jgi:hypothetical protein
MTYGVAIPGYRGIRALVELARRDPSRYPTMAKITTRAQRLFPSVYRQFIARVTRQQRGVAPPPAAMSLGYIIGGFDGNETAQFRIYSFDNASNFQGQEQLGPYFMAAQ